MNMENELISARKQLDSTAHALIRTDLQLRRSNESLERQLQLLHALHRVGMLITSSFDMEVILNALAESMVRDLDFEKSGVILLDRQGAKVIQSAYAGFSAREFLYFLDHLGGVLNDSTVGREEFSVQNMTVASPEWREFMQKMSVESMILLPIRIKSDLIGLIMAGHISAALRLTQAERSFFGMYAYQASTAIENSRLYEALGRANLTLEENVRERTRDLVQANEQLKDLDNEKSNFVSLVSHELRTPLTAIKGFVATLLQYNHDIPEDKRLLYLNILNSETDRLTRLITELLDISKIESGRQEIVWKPVKLPAVTQQVFSALAANAGNVQLVMDFPNDFPQINADVDKLEQVLVNLVSNALRYSPPYGVVSVRGRRYRDGVIVEVRDQGQGIPFGHLEKIFEKFYRIDIDVNRKNPGTGLGLPICRGLLNLHGGRIWAESEEGQGSCFIFTLPFNLDKGQQVPSLKSA
jgi:signal transduction histidine kinase